MTANQHITMICYKGLLITFSTKGLLFLFFFCGFKLYLFYIEYVYLASASFTEFIVNFRWSLRPMRLSVMRSSPSRKAAFSLSERNFYLRTLAIISICMRIRSTKTSNFFPIFIIPLSFPLMFIIKFL